MAKLNGSIEVGQTWMQFYAQLDSSFAYIRIFQWILEDEWGNRIDEGEWQTEPYESSFELYYDDLDPGSSYYLAIDVYNDQWKQISYYYKWFTTESPPTVDVRAYAMTGIDEARADGETGWITVDDGTRVYFTCDVASGYEFDHWEVNGDISYSQTYRRYCYASEGTVYAYAYAYKASTTYTISYNANGGSGAPSATSVTDTSSSKYITLSSGKPSRTGYTFLGWSTSSNASSASYSPGNSYYFSGSTTLYAVWKINTYTVSFNANGGSGAPGNQTKTYGSTLTLSSTKPTRTGYTFSHWNTASNGSGTTYSSGGSYTANASATLYAIWKENTFTVTFNANGGTGAPAAQTKRYSTALALSTTKPTRTGYSFLGWSTSASATSATYAAGGSFTTNANTTLYAVWKELTYTISYNANGGTGAPAAQTKSYTKTLTLSTTKPKRLGYTFLGWSTNSSATSATYATGGSFTTNATTTLYAVWKYNALHIFYGVDGRWIEGEVYYGQSGSWSDLVIGYGTAAGWKLTE